MTRSDRDADQLSADVLMRRVVRALDDLQAAWDGDIREAQRAREADRQHLREAETQARAEADAALGEGDVSAPLRAQVQRSFPEDAVRAVRITDAPASLADAAAEFTTLRARAENAAEALVAAKKAWQERLFSRRRDMPVVPETFWADVDRLSSLVQAAPQLRDNHVRDSVQALRARLQAATASEGAQRAARIESLAGGIGELTRSLDQGLERSGLAWTHPAWSRPAAAEFLQRHIRIGDLAAVLPGAPQLVSAPALLPFPFDAGLAIDSPAAHREAAVGLARSLTLRLLAAVPPGQLRCTFIDPVSLGRSVAELRHLAEFDSGLVDVKTWTSERDVERRLGELSDHLEVVISTYLRGQFQSIDDYNAQAGEVAEPYQLLVVFDFPEAFSSTSARQLLSLVENGPRCGVHTILVRDPAKESPHDLPLGRLLDAMQRVTWEGDAARLELTAPIGRIDHPLLPDAAPPMTFDADGRATTSFAELLLDVGRKATQNQNGPVTLSRLLPVINRLVASGRSARVPDVRPGSPALDHQDPSTWWTGTTFEGAAACLGRAGAQDVAALPLSSTEVAGGAIMVGLPRSGKSTALHAAVMTMCMAYPPEELELFLVDSKHGVEFKVYEDLPHARMVSIRSEREFAVAVLQSLDAEIEERASLMKERSPGRTNITEYRIHTGEVMPRIVVIMDEFHELFEEDDALGHQAFQAFSNIVRQGPFAGIHLVVASQTLASTPALDKETLKLLPMRVAFMCNESDADLVMGDDNREVRSLSRQGAGIFNPLRGLPAHNQPFQGLYVDPEERAALLTSLRTRATDQGLDRRPLVFDGDAPASRPSPSRAAGSARPPVLPVGEPFDLKKPVTLPLRRGRGANVLLLGALDEDDFDQALLGAVHSCMAGATASGLELDVVDFLGAEPTDDEIELAELCEQLGGRMFRGARGVSALADVAELVRRRQRDRDHRSTGRLLLLFGLHRALDLAPVPSFGYGDDDTEDTPGNHVTTILQEGPDVGVHVVACVDTLRQFDRRLGRDLLQEFDLRLVGSNTGWSDISAVTELHRDPTVRRSQLLLANSSKGSVTRMRAYPPFTTTTVPTATKET